MKFKQRKQTITTTDSRNEFIVHDEAQENNANDDVESDLEELADVMDIPVSEEDFVYRINDYIKECLATLNDKRTKHCKITQITEALRTVEKQFMKNIPQSCASCRGVSPQFRTENMIKIFQRGLSQKQKKSMLQKGLNFQVLDVNLQKSQFEMNSYFEQDAILDTNFEVELGTNDVNDEIIDEDGNHSKRRLY